MSSHVDFWFMINFIHLALMTTTISEAIQHSILLNCNIFRKYTITYVAMLILSGILG